MLSPDRKWFWDGTQWRPVAVHEAIFPTWQSVGAGLPAEPAAPAQRIPTPPPQARPYRAPTAPVYRAPVPARAAAPAQVVEVPLWQEAPAGNGLNKYMYAAAGVIGLIIVGVILSSMGTITFPWQQAPAAPAPVKQGPALSARSDSARADHLINGLLAPQIAGLGDSVALIRDSCPAGMTASCQDALVGVDNKAAAILPAIDREPPPLCIAPSIERLRADVVKLDSYAQLGVKGFKDNRSSEMSSGASGAISLYGQVQADVAAATTAAQACDTQPVGP